MGGQLNQLMGLKVNGATRNLYKWMPGGLIGLRGIKSTIRGVKSACIGGFVQYRTVDGRCYL